MYDGKHVLCYGFWLDDPNNNIGIQSLSLTSLFAMILKLIQVNDIVLLKANEVFRQSTVTFMFLNVYAPFQIFISK